MLKHLLYEAPTLWARQFSTSYFAESPTTSPSGKMAQMSNRAIGAMSDSTGTDTEKWPFTGAQKE